MTEKRAPLKFEITCETNQHSVTLETSTWWSDGEVVHYRVMCPCGKEHVGCSLPKN